jgi:hypothetical protein
MAVAWLLLLMLVAVPACVPGHASATPGANGPAERAALSDELEDDFEVEEEAEDEAGQVEVVCEEFEEGFELCEEVEAESAGSGPPEECLLQTARARAQFSRHRLTVDIRYTSVAPTRVYVDFRLRSGRGSLQHGLVKRRFSKKGRLRVSRRLSDAEMKRARTARHMLVTLDVPAAPGYCGRYFKRHLILRKAGPHRLVWLGSDSISGGL